MTSMCGATKFCIFPFLCFLSYALCKVSLPLLFTLTSDSSLELVIDARISAGSHIEAYFNSDWAHPASTQLQPGTRKTYRLKYDPPLFSDITTLQHLRIDITDVPDAAVEVFSISVRSGERAAWRATGAEIVGISRFSGIRDTTSENGTARFVTSGQDPLFAVTPHVLIAGRGLLSDLLVYIKTNFAVLVLLISLVLLIVFEFMRSELPIRIRGARALALMLFLIGLPAGLRYMAEKVFASSAEYQSVGLSVGASAFLGYAKTTEFRVFYLMVAATIAVGLGLGVLYRRFLLWQNCQNPPTSGQPVSKVSQLIKILLMAAVFLLIVAAFVPDAVKAFASLQDVPSVLDYDSLNIETWNYLYQHGLKPFRDFWFPYGMSSFVMGRAPSAVWAMYGHVVLLYFVLAYSLCSLLEQKWLWGLLGVGLLAVLDCGGYLRGTYRYGVALDVVATFSALSFLNRGRWLAVSFGLFGAYAFCFEPSQFLYALPGLLVIAVSGLRETEKQDARILLLRRWFLAGFTGTVALGLVAAYVSSQGQLLPLVQVYKRLGSSAVSSSIAGDMATWLGNPLTVEGFVLLGSLVVLAISTFLMIAETNRKNRQISAVVCAMSLLSCAIFCKHLVRPHMALQFVGIVILACVLSICVLRTAWSSLQRALVAVALGACMYALKVDNFVLASYAKVLSSAQKAGEGLAMLGASDDDEKRAYNYFFSRVRLEPVYPVIGLLAQVLSEVTTEKQQTPPFFVLGDEAFLYHVFRQAPPPFISLYNSSDIRDQRDIVDWLERVKPEIVVWNSRSLVFDGVPNTVRTPLIFRYVVSNYQLLRQQDGYRFLKRSPEALDNVQEWREVLGDEVQLGGIPGLSKIGERPRCQLIHKDASCIPVLKMGCQGSVARQKVSAKIILSRQAFTIVAESIPTRDAYYVRLDRMWFWPNHLPNTSTVATVTEDNCAVIEGRTLAADELY